MPVERYFVDKENLIAGEDLQIKESEFHHLAHVVRAQKGEIIELVNGKGFLAQAVIKELRKNCAEVKIEQVDHEIKSPSRLILAQALPHANRLDFILEKGTELGVDQFWLFTGSQSQKKESYPSRIERARTVTIAALKQCGRLYLPSIEMKPPIDSWKKNLNCTFYFGDLSQESQPFAEILKRSAPSFPIVFVTGPESGFSPQEIYDLKQLGAQGVKLHDNILRTETASLMAMSLLSHWLLSH